MYMYIHLCKCIYIYLSLNHEPEEGLFRVGGSWRALGPGPFQGGYDSGICIACFGLGVEGLGSFKGKWIPTALQTYMSVFKI